MPKVPTKVVIEIEAGKGSSKIYAGDELIFSQDSVPTLVTLADAIPDTNKGKLNKTFMEKCSGVNSEALGKFLYWLQELDAESKISFGEIAHCLAEMHNLHNGDMK